MIGVGEEQNTAKTTRSYSKPLSPRLLNTKVHISPISPHPLFTELEIMEFKEVGILTFGQFGQEEQSFSHTSLTLETSIVNLGLRLYQFGKLLLRLLIPTLLTNLQLCSYMKDITVDLEL
jgi:hypothetical protein